MKGNLKVISLLLVLFFIVGVFGYQAHLQALKDIEDRSATELLGKEAEFDRLKQEASRKDALINELRDSVSDLEERLQEALAELTSLAPENITEGAALAGSNYVSGKENLALFLDALTEAEKEDLFERLTQERTRRPEALQLTAHLTLNNVYGDFLDSLDLTEDERIELSDYMKVLLVQQQELAQQLRDGDISQEEIRKINSEYTMYDHLKNFLTEDELQKFTAYQQTLLARQRTQRVETLSNQMTTLVPSLNKETSRLAAEAIAKVQYSTTLEEGQSVLEYTTRLYDRASEELSQTLNEQELSKVREFMEIQKRLIQNSGLR